LATQAEAIRYAVMHGIVPKEDDAGSH
jgi:hypothetical protein